MATKNPRIPPDNYLDLGRAAVAARFTGPAQFALIQEPYTRRACLGWCGTKFRIPLALLDAVTVTLTEAEEERLPRVQASAFELAKPLRLQFADGETEPTAVGPSRVALQAHRNLATGTVRIWPQWPRWRADSFWIGIAVDRARRSSRPADEEALFKGTLDPEAYVMSRFAERKSA